MSERTSRNLEERETAEVFGRELKRIYQSKGKTIEDYFNSYGFQEQFSPHTERARIKYILGLLKSRDMKDYHRVASDILHGGKQQTIVESGDISGLTWNFPDFDVYVNQQEIFHNESVLNHLGGCMFNKQSQTAVFSDLMQGAGESAKWNVNTNYFNRLQKETKKILDNATKLRREIIRADPIFGLGWSSYKGVIALPFGETTPSILDIGKPDYDGEYDKRVPVESRAEGSHIYLHEFIKDERIRSICPNAQLDSLGKTPGTSYSNFPEDLEVRRNDETYRGFEDDLKALKEITYFLKESERDEEIEALGSRMVGVYDSVIRILGHIKEGARK